MFNLKTHKQPNVTKELLPVDLLSSVIVNFRPSTIRVDFSYQIIRGLIRFVWLFVVLKTLPPWTDILGRVTFFKVTFKTHSKQLKKATF